MALLQFRKISKGAALRAVFLCIIAVVTLLLPDFLNDGIIYAIAAYAILNGILGMMDFAFCEDRNSPVDYFNLIAAGMAAICGIVCIVYDHYFVAALPIFLGLLLIIESMVYFVAALCAKRGLKGLLIILSVLIAAGGLALMLFTFGFGGIITLSRMFGGLMLLSCISELLVVLMDRKWNRF